MFGPLLRFELRGHFRRPVTWLYVAIMFLLPFFAMSTDAVLVGSALGKVKRNSPYALVQVYAILLTIGQIITNALVGTTVLRDYDTGIHELLFTTRLSRGAYLGAKYLAAFLAMLLVFAAMPVGALIGSIMPWADRATLQAIHFWYYLQPYLLLVIPGVFFLSSLLFAVGSLTRSNFAVYVTGILLLVGYSVADDLIRLLDRDMLANLIDPFALRSLDLEARYWTPVQRNTQTLPIAGFLGVNRALWAGVGAAMLALAFRFVKLEKAATVSPPSRRAKTVVPSPVPVSLPQVIDRITTAPSLLAGWRSVTAFHVRSLLRSIPFQAIVAIGFIEVVWNAWYADANGQNRSWPMSWLMVESSVNTSSLAMVVLLTFFAGELVWRERQVQMDQVLDAAPVQDWSVLLGKYSAMMCLLGAFTTACTLGSMVVPFLKGYPHIDLRVYGLYVYLVDFPAWFTLTAAAFLVQSLVPRKAIGHVLMILIWTGNTVTINMGYTYRLLELGATPRFRWSDMNGVGPYLQVIPALHGFNLAVAALLLALTMLVWRRGTQMPRFVKRIRERFRGGTRWLAAGSTAGAAAAAGVFYYHASIENVYTTRKASERLAVAYERTWRRYEALPVPRVVGIVLDVDLEPSAGRARVGSRFTLVNRLPRPIDTILVNVAADEPGLAVSLDSLTFDRPFTVLKVDTMFGVRLIRLATPLVAGDSLRVRSVQQMRVRGYPNSEPSIALVKNGTFFNRGMFPTFAYATENELQSDELRRTYQLPLQRRGQPRTDREALFRQSFLPDGDQATFEAVISTDPDQIALTSGYLQRAWRQDGRQYFQYRMDAPINNFFSVLSARWTVTRGTWQDVPIEIYHHSGHRFNVPRMIAAAQASLAFFSREFGPYQHRQLRILEFPRYEGFAQSFPNTVPYSEAIGFVARVDTTDVEDTDLPYFVTAHEIAHQWFPYHRMSADVEGAQMLSESLAEYAALVITTRAHGRAFTQKFLRAELEQYLRGRAREAKGEHPLTRVDLQSYIWYQKGSLALYALRDLIGEPALHGAIRAYLAEGRFGGPPYATTLDLMRHIRTATPDSLQTAIDDYFDTITLWDVKTDSVITAPQPDGRFKVTVVGTAAKVRADSLGAETPVPLNDYIDVGVFDAPRPGARLGEPIAIRKVKVTSGIVRAEFLVPRRPVRAGIDPYNLLIDRVPSDNSRDAKQ